MKLFAESELFHGFAGPTGKRLIACIMSLNGLDLEDRCSMPTTVSQTPRRTNFVSRQGGIA
jgi:hypothetical protein